MGAQWKAKHKDIAANAKGRLFGKLVKEIVVAARNGADPASNARLRLVVEQARKVSMPKDTLDRAIKKGAGLTGEAVNYEHVIYEGFAPHRVPVMVECLTDNVNRTAPEMRVLFRKGQLGTHAKTVGADKAYDTADFVAACRQRKVTPHVAQNDGRRGGSAIDQRTTRHEGYRISQVIRKRIEEHFGWGKTVGRIRQTVFRGIQRVDQQFKLTMTASNLTRMARILFAVPQEVRQ